MEQDAINKYRKLYAESTNELVKKTAKEKLEQAGISLTETKEEKKEEKKTEAKASTKATAKTTAKATSKKPKRDENEEDPDCEELEEREVKAKESGYDLDELLSKAKKSKAKAKARAIAKKKEPKKTPATKSREAIEKTATRVKKGASKLTAIEIEKLIGEYEDAIKDLKKLLIKAKEEQKKMAKGGGVEWKEKEPKVIYTQFEDEEYEYARGSRIGGRKTSDPDKRYSAEKRGQRESENVSKVKMLSGGAYKRKNANQFYNDHHKTFTYYSRAQGRNVTVRVHPRAQIGGREYTENRKNRSDKSMWK